MMTPQDAPRLRRDIDRLERQLKAAKQELRYAVNSCNHQWGEIKYTPTVRKAYTTPGDPPGTMGIDWRGPVHVPSETTRRWTRTCRVCKHTETTTRTTDKVEKIPHF